MRAGDLRHRLTIQSRATTQNKYGEKGDEWGDGPTVWGAIRPMGINESVEADKSVGMVTHLVTLRAPGIDVGAENRLRFGDRVFEVVGTLDWDEIGEMLRVTCRETT